MKTKHLLVKTLENGKPVGHPLYIEKSILQQVLENAWPWLTFVAGVLVGGILF